jgi:hypothetical protein
MKIAFVGVKRKFSEIPEDYRNHFVRYHLELPFYYARDGKNDVYVSTVDHDGAPYKFEEGGSLRCVLEDRLEEHGPFDVVIHWRKWFDDLYQGDGAVNVINCQDHSFSHEWKHTVVDEFCNGKMKAILCFPTWHKHNLFMELEGRIPMEHLWDGLTLGVDTDVFKPDWTNKDPYKLLWSSDPGRGLPRAIELAVKLHARDRRFKLHVCYPDYVPDSTMVFKHPAIEWHGKIPNGPKLWDLFNTSGVLPYTSCFREPSSRAHRQAMSAGSMVLYPPEMGSPSNLIPKDAGLVVPIDTWADLIYREVNSAGWMTYGYAAREFAISENWAVQARRFNKFFEERVRR